MMLGLRYMGVLGASLAVLLAGYSAEKANSAEPKTIRAGYVSAIDQMGISAAVDQGFFEARGLDVKLAQPFPSGVDALNALQTGAIQFAQVGTPLFGALLSGMDVVSLSYFTGTAARLRLDETMSMVARQGSGIDPKNLSTLKGKKIGITVGSTNHIYVTRMLAAKGIKQDEVKLINTAPPDMAVALQTGGLDAFAVWDPWPVAARKEVAGSYEVIRGGGYVANVGYIVAMRDFIAKNPDIVERFLAARAEADQWIRKNPDAAGELATRWIPGSKLDVAKEAMGHVRKLVDARFSGCNLLAMQEGFEFTLQTRNLKPPAGFDLFKYVEPKFMDKIVKEQPRLFADLAPIPAAAVLPANNPMSFNRATARTACGG